jgi:hypothetical protein
LINITVNKNYNLDKLCKQLRVKVYFTRKSSKCLFTISFKNIIHSACCQINDKQMIETIKCNYRILRYCMNIGCQVSRYYLKFKFGSYLIGRNFLKEKYTYNLFQNQKSTNTAFYLENTTDNVANFCF